MSERLREAQSIVSEQTGCSIAAALDLLDRTASATDEPLEVVAELVVCGEVRFGAEGYERQGTAKV